MCDSIKIPVSEVETNDLSEESGCKVNPADVTCHQIVDLNSEMQLEYSKKLPNFPDKNTNLNEFEPGFKESSNNISDELSKNKKPEDHNLSHYPKPVHKSDNEKKILGDQNNAKEILPKDFVHPHNEDNLLKDVDQHADEKEILQDVHNVEESLPKNVMVLGDKDILTKDVIDQHTEEKEILEDVHGVEGSLPENVMVLSDKDILPKDVIDQHDAENIDSKHLNLHDDNIPFSDVDQHNDTILPKSTEKQIDKAILSKDAIFDDDSCDFLPKDDVNQPNAVDNLCDVNDLNSQEPKQTQMTDEDSLSSDSRSPLKFETESSERFCKSRERSALPYFQLPKPDLEEFLIETDKKLHDNEIKSPNVQQEVETSKSQFSKDQFIVFEIGPLTPMDKFKNKFLNQTKQHTEPSPRVSPKTYQGLQINSPLLSKEMEEKDSPGFKRLVLKEYLKQKIDEKKVAAFNRFKEASKLDEEEEMYVESDDSGESLSDSESNEFRKRIEKMMAPKEAGDVLELEKEKELPENLEGACSDSEKLEIETEDLEPADDGSDDDILPNVISQNNKNVSNDHNSFHTDSEESEDEIMFTKKSKQCKRLVDDSDEESDLNNVSYGHSQIENKTKVIEKLAGMSEENSLDSVDAAVNERNDECDSVSSVSSSNQDVSLEANNAFQKSFQKNSKDYFTATPEISSSAIPSYQPGGGFQDEESNSSLDSISCRSKGIVSKKCLKNGISDSFLSSQGSVENRSFSSSTQVDAIEMNNQFVGDHSLNKAPKFGVSLDDLPISQGDSDNIFASQDVDNICSGIFHDSVPPRSLLEESILKLKDPDTAVATEKVEDFLDAEAELSGEDDGLDDDSDEEGNEVNDIIAADDDLPSDEELRDGIADLFMKRINDDDDMLIKKVQEHFLDDGELNTDGAGRSRRFQWRNDDIENNDQNNMSESDNEEPDESWNALNREKAKWQLENVKQLTEDLTPEEFVKKPILRMKILGKPDNLIDMNNALPMHQKRKRTRGSLFNLDDGSASQVLKRLKAAEDSTGGSRTTKHFVFRNDVVGSDVAETKEVAVAFTRQTSSTRVEVGELSVFDKI